MKSNIFCMGPVFLALLGGPVAYFLLLKIPWVRNTAWPNVFILLIAVSWALIQLRQEHSTCASVVLAVTLAIAAGFLYVRFGLASLPEAHVNVAVGSEAPGFKLPDSEDREFVLSDLRGKENVVLVFYHGMW